MTSQLSDGYIVVGSEPMFQLVTAWDCVELFSPLGIPEIFADTCISHLGCKGSLFLAFQRCPLVPGHSGDAPSHPSAPAKTRHLQLVVDLGCPRSLTFDYWACFILPSWAMTSHWKETWKPLRSISLVCFQFPLKKKRTPKNPSRTQHPPANLFLPQTLGFGGCCPSYGQRDSFLNSLLSTAICWFDLHHT